MRLAFITDWGHLKTTSFTAVDISWYHITRTPDTTKPKIAYYVGTYSSSKPGQKGRISERSKTEPETSTIGCYRNCALAAQLAASFIFKGSSISFAEQLTRLQRAPRANNFAKETWTGDHFDHLAALSICAKKQWIDRYASQPPRRTLRFRTTNRGQALVAKHITERDHFALRPGPGQL